MYASNTRYHTYSYRGSDVTIKPNPISGEKDRTGKSCSKIIPYAEPHMREQLSYTSDWPDYSM